MTDVAHVPASLPRPPACLLAPVRHRFGPLLLALGLLAGCTAGAADPGAPGPAAPSAGSLAVAVPALAPALAPAPDPALAPSRAALTAAGGTTGSAGGYVQPSGTAWGRTELCGEYCSCMGSGKCTGRQPSNCMSTCMSNAGNWNLPCRIEKCKSANKDYSDQVGGSCSTSAGIQGCWDKDKLVQAQ